MRALVLTILFVVSFEAHAGGEKLHDEIIGFPVTDAHVSKVAEMLRTGADVNEQDERGNAIVFKVLAPKDRKYLELLLKNGVDLNARNRIQHTPLMSATYFAATSEDTNPSTVELLLKSGADANAETKNHSTALFLAVTNIKSGRDLRLLKVLLKGGADVNKPVVLGRNKVTAVSKAAHDGKNDVIRLLASHGADLNLTGSSGVSPLESAELGRHPETVALLKSLGAKK